MISLRKKPARYFALNSILLFVYLAAVFAVDFYLEPLRKTFYIAIFIGLAIACPLTIGLLQRHPGIRTRGGKPLRTAGKRVA